MVEITSDITDLEHPGEKKWWLFTGVFAYAKIHPVLLRVTFWMLWSEWAPPPHSCVEVLTARYDGVRRWGFRKVVRIG